MSHAEFEIDLHKSPAYEAGAVLITLLALPKGNDNARARLMASLCHLALKAQFDLDSAEARTEQLIKPIYALRSEKEVARDLRTLRRLLRDRVVAGRMAIAFLKEPVTGSLPKLPKEIAWLSLNELSKLAAKDLGQAGDAGNVEARVWHPSLPVIHLAAAIAVAIDMAGRDGLGEIHIGHLLTHRWLIEWIVNAAEHYATFIEKGGVLPGKPVSLIHLRIR